VMRFAEDGRCSHFEEWPFWPEQRTSVENFPRKEARCGRQQDRSP
jgi:hypothetical protein